MLLTASVLALYPTMTLEKTQNGSAVVSIKADGKAFQNQKGKASSTFSSAALTLYGSVAAKGNGGLELDDLAGSLQIGIANYTITSGSGEVNKKGTIEINAKTSDAGKNAGTQTTRQHSRRQCNLRRQGKQTLLTVLPLPQGQAIVTMPTTSTSMTESDDEHDHNHHYGDNTVTVTQTNTVTETVTQFQNQTLTVTQTSTATVTEPSNQTMTETVTQTITEPPSTATVTLTETVTSTIANTTITVTAPSTNTTLTTTQI